LPELAPRAGDDDQLADPADDGVAELRESLGQYRCPAPIQRGEIDEGVGAGRPGELFGTQQSNLRAAPLKQYR
jgi:hypothetical protein